MTTIIKKLCKLKFLSNDRVILKNPLQVTSDLQRGFQQDCSVISQGFFFSELKKTRSVLDEKPFADHMWPAKGFSAWPLCDLTRFSVQKRILLFYSKLKGLIFENGFSRSHPEKLNGVATWNNLALKNFASETTLKRIVCWCLESMLTLWFPGKETEHHCNASRSTFYLSCLDLISCVHSTYI